MNSHFVYNSKLYKYTLSIILLKYLSEHFHVFLVLIPQRCVGYCVNKENAMQIVNY